MRRLFALGADSGFGVPIEAATDDVARVFFAGFVFLTPPIVGEPPMD